MLSAIGAGSLDELFADIPEGVRLERELDLRPAARSRRSTTTCAGWPRATAMRTPR